MITNNRYFEALPLYKTQIAQFARTAAFQGKLNLAIVGDTPLTPVEVLQKELDNLQAPYTIYNMNNPAFKILSFREGTFERAREGNKIVILRNCDAIFGPIQQASINILNEMLNLGDMDIITVWNHMEFHSPAEFKKTRLLLHSTIRAPATEREFRHTLAISD